MLAINKLKITNEKIIFTGIPFDDYSTFLKGTSLGPDRIREALHSDSSNYFTESGINVFSDVLYDTGNIDFSNSVDKYNSIESWIDKLLENKLPVISLGGDHSITFPIIKAYSKHYKKINILHFDAHPDLYEEFEGNKFSHACPFARIMEGEYASSITQVGIRTLNDHQKEQALKYNVNIIDMINIDKAYDINLTDPVYISFDMDVLDPAFAPGLSHYEPGGLSVREVIKIIQRLNCKIIGADIVECNPIRDINNMTAMVAAKILKEITSKIV